MNNDQNKSFIGVLLLFTAVMGAVGLTHLGNVLTPVTGDLPWNPFTLGIQLATGAVDWPTAATFLVGLEVVVCVAALMVWGTRTPSKTQEAAQRMSPPGRINPAMSAARTTEAHRLHPEAENIGPGLTIGLVGKNPIYQGWR